jgi:hypothetical protein
MGKSKAEQRREAIERLKKIESHSTYLDLIKAILGVKCDDTTLKQDADNIIDLLTDYEPDERYMRLPVDADGVPIHINDTLEWSDGERLTVVGIGSGVVFYDDDDGVQWTMTVNKHHYHKLTVEDVLREFCDEVRRCCDTEDTIAEYAAKLQLKEEVDEA